ncbi:MAG: hypothetical protein IH840_14840 [Candidatus Heimdallarchaeota archaeon]|nr:hypothetical protein [Candidatus Heimdallarchaeota archaeon]
MNFRDSVLQVIETENVPSGYKRLGDKVILRSKFDLTEKLGRAVLEVLPWSTSVFQHLTTTGEVRRPKLKFLAGDRDTLTVHIENGVKYALDIANITFSGGNSQLRKRLITTVHAGEQIVDMFAAVGNLTLQAIKYNNIEAILVERNEYTYQFLLKTLKLNNLSDVVTKNQDSRNLKTLNWADRVFMGYHAVARDHLASALRISKAKSILHLHPLAKNKEYQKTLDIYTSHLEKLGAQIEKVEIQKVKSFAPGVDHIEITYSIQK